MTQEKFQKERKYLRIYLIGKPMNLNRYIKIIAFLLIIVVSCDTKNTVEPRFIDVFVKYHGGDGDQSVAQFAQTVDGGFIMVGTSVSNGAGSEILVIKTDALGNEEWQFTFGRGINDTGKAIALAADGSGYYVVGNSVNSLGFTDVLVLKLNNSGIEDIRSVVGTPEFNEEVNDIIVLNANDKHGAEIMLAGSSTNTDVFYKPGIKPPTLDISDNYDFYFPKLDANLMDVNFNKADTLWKGYWGEGGSERAVSVVQNSKNEFVFFGETNRPERTDQVDIVKDKNNYLIKFFDESELPGNIGGGATYGTQDDQFASKMVLTDNGEYLTVGTTIIGNNSEIFINRIKETMDAYVVRSVVEEANITGKSIVQTNDGGYLILGSIDRNANSDIYLVKTNWRGAVVWEQVFGGNNEDTPGDLLQLADGSIVFTCTITLENQKKIGLFKTNENGELMTE